jgi:hypothetical protein
MKRLLWMLVIPVVLSTTLAAPVDVHASTLVAVDKVRCNERATNAYDEQMSDFEHHPPGNSLADLQKRLAEIGGVLTGIGQERNVLDNVCAPGDPQRLQLFGHIAAVVATGFALISDLALQGGSSCPAGAKASADAFLAEAWLSLARIVNEVDGKVPPSIAPTIPKIQSRAAALGFALPAWADTSAYWRDQVKKAANDADAVCAAPPASPAALPGSSASPAASPAPSPMPSP